MSRRDYSGAAVPTTLASGINSSATSITIVDATGWPAGTNGPFFVVIDPGLAGEEKVLCLSRSTTTLTVVTSPVLGRGADGTTASAHSTAAAIYPCGTATDLDEANKHINDITADDHSQYLTVARHDTTARHQFGGALGTPAAATDIGTVPAAGVATGPARADHVHQIGGGAIDGSGMFAAGVIDAAAINNDAVTTTAIIDDAVTTPKIVDSAVTSAKIADATITTGDISDSAITAAKIAADAVTTVKVLDANITRAKLATDAQKSVDVAWGQIALAVSTTDGTGITSEINIVSATVTFTAVANRRYQYRLFMPAIGQASNPADVKLKITDGSDVQKGSASTASILAGKTTPMMVLVNESNITPGSTTRKGRISSNASGAVTNGLSAPGFIEVVDIGPS